MKKNLWNLLSKTLLITALCLFSWCSSADQTRMIVAPVNVVTGMSSYSIYPNITESIANELINRLNNNLRFDVPDINATENLIMSQGLYEEYRDFLKNFKDKGIIDYKICSLLQQRLGVDRILLVSSGFNMQNMILKRPFYYKLTMFEFEPIKSYYRLNVTATLVDASTGLVVFSNTFHKDLSTKNFEIPTNSLSDNAMLTEEIKQFSDNISSDIAVRVFTKTQTGIYTEVQSKIATPLTSARNVSTDGKMTTDGLPLNNLNLKNKRKDSFNTWLKNSGN